MSEVQEGLFGIILRERALRERLYTRDPAVGTRSHKGSGNNLLFLTFLSKTKPHSA